MNFVDQVILLLQIVLWDNSVGRYFFALSLFIGLMVTIIFLKKFLLHHLSKIASKTANDFDDFIIGLVAQVGRITIGAVSLYMASLFLTLPDVLRSLIKYILVVVLTVRVIFFLEALVYYGIRKIYKKRISDTDPAGEAMIKSLTGILRWVIWSVGFVFVLSNLGVNISALVAGIGIGGIAVALAAQAVLADAFSAFSIFLDKPFEIGDFIIVDDYLGTVEHIGIKTTRIRSLSGEQLIFPNSNLTNSRVKNYKRMDTRRILFKIGIVYQTPIEKVRRIPEMVRLIFSKINGVRLDRVHFGSFGDFALVYEIVYYVLSADYNIYMDKQQEINLALMEEFEKEKISFAYPTQTLYVAKEGC